MLNDNKVEAEVEVEDEVEFEVGTGVEVGIGFEVEVEVGVGIKSARYLAGTSTLVREMSGRITLPPKQSPG